MTFQAFFPNLFEIGREKNVDFYPNSQPQDLDSAPGYTAASTGDDPVAHMEVPALLSVSVQYPSCPPSAASLSMEAGQGLKLLLMVQNTGDMAIQWVASLVCNLTATSAFKTKTAQNSHSFCILNLHSLLFPHKATILH